MRIRPAVYVVALAFVLLGGLTDGGASGAGVQPAQARLAHSNSSSALPTSAQIVTAVTAAAKLTAAPADLAPPANNVPGYGGLSPQQQPCDSTYAVTTPPSCQIGDAKGKTAIVLWGDSHAAMWMPALQAIALHLNDRLYVFSKAACAANSVEPAGINGSSGPYTACATFKKHVLTDIAKIHPALIVMTGAFKGWAYTVNGTAVQAGTFTSTPGVWIPSATGESTWNQGLKSTLRTLRRMAGRVAVIGDIPYPLQDEATCLSAHASDLKACAISIGEAVYSAHNKQEAAITKAAGDTYVSVTQWMCTKTVCPPVISTYAVYLDSYHITSEFSEWLSDALGVSLGLLPK